MMRNDALHALVLLQQRAALTMYAKWPSVTQVLRWFWIAVRMADVRPCFRAATISCSSPYGEPFTTLYTCDT